MSDHQTTMSKSYYVYILTNKKNVSLYIGVTNDLERRIYEHKNKLVKGFTERYCVDKLVHYEETSDVESALQREKQLKRWGRKWKIDLIERTNPKWNEIVLR